MHKYHLIYLLINRMFNKATFILLFLAAQSLAEKSYPSEIENTVQMTTANHTEIYNAQYVIKYPDQAWNWDAYTQGIDWDIYSFRADADECVMYCYTRPGCTGIEIGFSDKYATGYCAMWFNGKCNIPDFAVSNVDTYTLLKTLLDIFTVYENVEYLDGDRIYAGKSTVDGCAEICLDATTCYGFESTYKNDCYIITEPFTFYDTIGKNGSDVYMLKSQFINNSSSISWLFGVICGVGIMLVFLAGMCCCMRPRRCCCMRSRRCTRVYRSDNGSTVQAFAVIGSSNTVRKFEEPVRPVTRMSNVVGINSDSELDDVQGSG